MYNLIGEISDSSDEDDTKLEDYLTSTTPIVAKELPKISKSQEIQPELDRKKNITPSKVRWKKTARFGIPNETVRGWLKKSTRKRIAQKRVLHKSRPGTTALREIKFYQKCRAFLIPQKSFGRLVQIISRQDRFMNCELRWQSVAIYVLQGATEAYLSGFLMDANLCALHRRVITIAQRDVWLAIQLRGREHLGGKPNVSDTGVFNTGEYFSSDPSEKQRFRLAKWHRLPYESTEPQDWNKLMVQKSFLVPIAKGGPKQSKRHQLGPKTHTPSMAAIARLARKGGVRRMARSLYPEIRGVLYSFLEVVLSDIIAFVEYSRRKTVIPTDVIFALKRHGRNLYGYPH